MSLFRRKPVSPSTRVFFATDVHGSERTYRKFLNAGKFYEANVLVMGGDILGKMAIPIIQETDGRYRATLQGRTESLEGVQALQDLLARIGTLGLYSKVMTEDEFRSVQADPAAVEALFKDLARQRLEAWVELAEERLAGSGIRCFVTGGNDDYPEVLEALYGSDRQAIFGCEGRLVDIDGQHSMISMGYSTPTPWRTPREVSDEKLGEMIAEMTGRVADPSRCIFNFHDPPVDSTLDTCPKLDWSTDPPAQIRQGGQVVMFGAGSRSVRRAIETLQPMLGLHGHIHESPGAVKLGRTLCVNPGSEYGEGVLRGALLSVAGGEVTGYQLTAG
jgi:Icc-related predicted phosphoesterase